MKQDAAMHRSSDEDIYVFYESMNKVLNKTNLKHNEILDILLRFYITGFKAPGGNIKQCLRMVTEVWDLVDIKDQIDRIH